MFFKATHKECNDLPNCRNGPTLSFCFPRLFGRTVNNNRIYWLVLSLWTHRQKTVFSPCFSTGAVSWYQVMYCVHSLYRPFPQSFVISYSFQLFRILSSHSLSPLSLSPFLFSSFFLSLSLTLSLSIFSPLPLPLRHVNGCKWFYIDLS